MSLSAVLSYDDQTTDLTSIAAIDGVNYANLYNIRENIDNQDEIDAVMTRAYEYIM